MNATRELPRTISDFDVERIRRDFPILSTRLADDKQIIYLDNAATSQCPRPVIQAMADVYERSYANVHRGIHTLSERATELYEGARESIRRFLNAKSPEEIILTHGTTESINLVARSWGDANVRTGDEILLTMMEHHSNIVPWQQLAERTGAVIKYLDITDDGVLRLESIDELLGSRTRMVAVTAVSNVLGTINPLPEIIRRARHVGARVLIDGAQSVPHLPTDVQSLGADFLAFSGHKLLGPSGVGVLWGRRDLLEAMPPFLGGGGMIGRVELDRFEAADPPAKFEAGTPAIVPTIGLAAAISYLNLVGFRAISEHERRLTERAHEVLAAIRGTRIFGPSPDQKGGIVSFTVNGIHAHDVAQVLDRHGVEIRAGHHCAMPLHQRLGIRASARASFYIYNTLAEVDAFGAALERTKALFRRG
jgi:cysteine desulfurase/selenocysteine lyase